MKNILYKLVVSTGLAFGLISFSANAGLMTSGEWSDKQGNAVVDGLGTNKIEWGSHNEGWNNGKNSSWLFEGVSSSDPWVDGEYFMIGWLTHKNQPIYDYDFLGATLNVSLAYGGETSMASFMLGHKETLNKNCTPGCADIVTLLDATETINIGGMWYELMFKGFDDNDQLETPEKGWSDAHLYIAKVPEPSIIALFGIGLLGLGFASRRKANG